MSPEINAADRNRLRHMLDAARQAMEFSDGMARADLESNAMYRRALISCIQEIGEAAVRVSQETRDQTAALPWKQMVAMGNRLVHVYFAINLDLVWEVAARDLVPLIAELEKILPPQP